MRRGAWFTMVFVCLVGCGTAADFDPETPPSCAQHFRLQSDEDSVLETASVVHLYWGRHWTAGNRGQAHRDEADRRAARVFGDPRFWAPLREYSSPKQRVRGGAWGGGHRANSALADDASLGDAELETELATEIDALGAAAPKDALYVIWLPPGVVTPRLEGLFAYHAHIRHGGRRVPYAAVKYKNTWQDLGDAMFISETHELYEAMTDPYMTGWATDGGDEIGDVCSRARLGVDAVTAWDLGDMGTMNVQKEWSLRECGCVDIARYGEKMLSSGGAP